ncbi:PREDICTED: ADP-ribosylation factor-related protein 1 [Colobus angolensis palliatus]|uniref:ADP-ribosylation factor-related protein 1 n=1 Tax=Colobus angolensis palliatus TaxID=336983 RepID=UPI0005F4A2D8|nr:PREDICTED: ADP-ribosylation factor-related protein 1 [Colobus angolensis palliatus]
MKAARMGEERPIQAAGSAELWLAQRGALEENWLCCAMWGQAGRDFTPQPGGSPVWAALGRCDLFAARYYAECHGVIYVIDSTDEERLAESKQAFEKVVTSEALCGVPILVLANKQDVETCLSIPDIKTAFSDCTSKIGRRDCLTQACSALTGKGVREGIEWMVKCVVRNVHRPPRQRDIT